MIRDDSPAFPTSSADDQTACAECSFLRLRLRRMTGAFLAAAAGNMFWVFARDMSGSGWLWPYLQPIAAAFGLVFLSFACWYLTSPPQRLNRLNSQRWP